MRALEVCDHGFRRGREGSPPELHDRPVGTHPWFVKQRAKKPSFQFPLRHAQGGHNGGIELSTRVQRQWNRRAFDGWKRRPGVGRRLPATLQERRQRARRHPRDLNERGSRARRPA